MAMSSSYHPQSDGQTTENLNKILEMYLRCYIFDHLKNWIEMLPWAQYWYNFAFHHSMGMSPYQVVYGKPPPSLIRYKYSEYDPSAIQDSLKMRDALLNKLKVKLQQSQNYMKSKWEEN